MSKKILDKKQIEDFFNDPYNEEVIELISNTIASYIVSAITANLSPDLIKKALTDIIKTLSPEQPSETKEQNIDIKEKTKDWSKHSDATLRRERNRRKQKGLPIEDSLNEELAKRFPGYDPKTKTFKRNKKAIDLSKSSDNRKPIEDSLNEELAKRFPNYNKGTRCFGKNIKRITNTDWSKSSENSIKTTYYARKKKGKPIEDSLNEELAKRFPNYNPEKKSFGNGHKNISSSNTRITNQKESTPNTNVKQTHTNIAITIPLFSAINKNGKYDLYTYDKENKPIKLIKNSIAEYDLYFYDDAFNKAVVRKKNDINSFSLYIIDTQKGSLLRLFNQGIDILRYIPQNHKILLSGKNSFYYTAIAPNSKIEKIINVPLNVEILKAQSTPKHTVLINKNCEEIKVPLLKITDESKLEKRNNLINHLLGKLSSTPQIKESKSENQNVKEGKQEIKQNTDWSKSSENSIKTAYYTRKKKGKPIEDSLNEELAKRFDNYDKEQKAFTPRQKSKKDWCKYSDISLRNIYYSRKRESLPIEDSLNEELAKRFPGYDPKTKTFKRNKKAIDLSKSSDNRTTEYEIFIIQGKRKTNLLKTL